MRVFVKIESNITAIKIGGKGIPEPSDIDLLLGKAGKPDHFYSYALDYFNTWFTSNFKTSNIKPTITQSNKLEGVW